VGSFANPVVISNIVIAAMHLTTLGLILIEMQRKEATPDVAG
jgi:hypothetical protein